MRLIKKNLPVFLSLIFSLLIFSCDSVFGNDEDDMIDEYNSGFTSAAENSGSTDSTSSSNPGDSDFDEDDMLMDYYMAPSNSTLVLSAPEAQSYKWTFVDDSDGTDITNSVVFLSGYHSWTQVIMIYIPDSVALQEGKTYRVTLTVTAKGGRTYKDVCGLVIYALLDGGKY